MGASHIQYCTSVQKHWHGHKSKFPISPATASTLASQYNTKSKVINLQQQPLTFKLSGEITDQYVLHSDCTSLESC